MVERVQSNPFVAGNITVAPRDRQGEGKEPTISWKKQSENLNKTGVLKFKCVLPLGNSFWSSWIQKENFNDSKPLSQVLSLQSQQMTRRRWHLPHSIGLDMQVLKRCTVAGNAKVTSQNDIEWYTIFLHTLGLIALMETNKAENNCLNLRTCQYLVQTIEPEHLKHSALRSNHWCQHAVSCYLNGLDHVDYLVRRSLPLEFFRWTGSVRSPQLSLNNPRVLNVEDASGHMLWSHVASSTKSVRMTWGQFRKNIVSYMLVDPFRRFAKSCMRAMLLCSSMVLRINWLGPFEHFLVSACCFPI